VKSTRRDVITTFLGLASAHGCRAPSPPIPTTLVDSFLERGHKLRRPLPTPPDISDRFDVLVVGAGAAGLSAGWRLAPTGLTFAIAELDDDLGGTAKQGQSSVTPFPWGAHYLPAPLSTRGPVPKLLSELGVLTGVTSDGQPEFDEAALIHAPEQRLFYLGRWYPGEYLHAGASADDLSQLRRFEEAMNAFATATDSRGRKAFAVPMALGSDESPFIDLDRLSMAQWLTAHGFTSPRLRWLVDYACRDDYGASAPYISAWAAIWYFAARRTGADESEGFLSWPEGNGHLIHGLARAIGKGRVLRGRLVHTVTPTEAGCLIDAWDEATQRPTRSFARRVILACPRFVAARLVAPWRRQPPSFLPAFATSPWVVANLHVNTLPQSRGAPLAWDNVIYQSKSLGYVVATHQRLAARTQGPSVLSWYYPVDGADPKAEREKLLATSAADWRDIVLADLRPAHFSFEKDVSQIEVLRWGHAMVRPSPGFVFGPHRQQAAQAAGPIHFAHSDLSGLPLFEEANWHGVRAAEEVAAALGQTTPSWL
jgi:hypothetical protein